MSAEMIPVAIDTRRCFQCGQRKPLDEFHLCADKPLGRHYQCRACKSAYGRKRYAEQSAPRRAAAAARKAVEWDARRAVSTQVCTGCHEEKPLSAFRWRAVRQRPALPIQRCRACESEARLRRRIAALGGQP